MKNIDEIKQVVNKKCLKQQLLLKGKEKEISKDKKIKYNLIKNKK